MDDPDPVYAMAIDDMDDNPNETLMRRLHSMSTKSNESRSSSFNIPPQPFYCSNVERATGGNDTPLWKQTWMKRFIEIKEDKLRIFPSQLERYDQGLPIQLSKSNVYLQGRHVWLELFDDDDKRIFRLPSDELAWRLYIVLSRFCWVPPFAEGFCRKLSGGKGDFEDRMLRITSEGVLEWLKPGNSSSQGAIQMRGLGIDIDSQLKNKLLISSKSRIFEFNFFNNEEADYWYQILSWHSTRPRLEFTSLKAVRE